MDAFEEMIEASFGDSFHHEPFAVKTVMVDAREATDAWRVFQPTFEVPADQPRLTNAFREAFESELVKCGPVPVSLVVRNDSLALSIDFSEHHDHPLAFLVVDLDLPIFFDFEIGMSHDGDVTLEFEHLGAIGSRLLIANMSAMSDVAQESLQQLIDHASDREWQEKHAAFVIKDFMMDELESIGVVLIRQKLMQMLMFNACDAPLAYLD